MSTHNNKQHQCIETGAKEVAVGKDLDLLITEKGVVDVGAEVVQDPIQDTLMITEKTTEKELIE
mgnify:CR=1 FL=1